MYFGMPSQSHCCVASASIGDLEVLVDGAVLSHLVGSRKHDDEYEEHGPALHLRRWEGVGLGLLGLLGLQLGLGLWLAGRVRAHTCFKGE